MSEPVLDSFKSFINQTDIFRERIVAHEKELVELLGTYETYETATDEIERAIATLTGFSRELMGQKRVSAELKMATFFPLNLPLYSLVLFAVAPLAHCNHIYIRMPQVMQRPMEAIVSLLGISQLFPELQFLDVKRSVFVEVYAKQSDAILFTGRYENALKVQQRCAESLFIYNGSGLNPAFVFPGADLRLAAKKIYQMRTYNSGQDCAGTDAIFIHEDIIDEFLKKLMPLILQTRVGRYADHSTQVGPILREDYVQKVEDYLRQNQEYIFHKGLIDNAQSLVSPFVLVRGLRDLGDNLVEFFAPIFNIYTFNDKNIDIVLDNTYITEHSMYTSCFGGHPFMQKYAKEHLTIYNKNINDAEQGNSPYGGFGVKANFISFGALRAVRPVLVNKELFNFFTRYELG